MKLIEQVFTVPGTGEQAVLKGYLRDNIPYRSGRLRPAMIICPGGAYERCSLREGEPVALKFMEKGCQCFVLDYSVAPVRFPAALRQLAMAVAWVREHAADWDIDPQRVFVCGFSAGGHLAASLGVFWNRPFVCEHLGLKKESIRPDGLILSYPVICAGGFAHEGSMVNLGIRERLELGAGEQVQQIEGEELTELFSLEKQVHGQVPPTFLWHTQSDGSVPVENSLLFSMALRAAGVPFELHVFPEGRHGLSLADGETDKEGEDGYVVPCCQIWPELAWRWMGSFDGDMNPVDFKRQS